MSRHGRHRRRGVMLTPVTRGPFAKPWAGTVTREQLDDARAKVARADASRARWAAIRWDWRHR